MRMRIAAVDAVKAEALSPVFKWLAEATGGGRISEADQARSEIIQKLEDAGISMDVTAWEEILAKVGKCKQEMATAMAEFIVSPETLTELTDILESVNDATLSAEYAPLVAEAAQSQQWLIQIAEAPPYS